MNDVKYRLRAPIRVLAALLISGGDAGAQTEVVVTGADRHLHLNRQELQVYRAARGIDGIGAGRSWYTSKDYRWFLSKGLVPISDERFIELIEASQTSPLLVNKIRGRQLSAGIWAGLSVSTLILASAAGTYMAMTGFTRLPADEEGNRPLKDQASGNTGVGLIIGGAVTSAVLLIPIVRSFPEDPAGEWLKSFTYEEAQEAIDNYNKWVDKAR